MVLRGKYSRSKELFHERGFDTFFFDKLSIL